MSFHRNVVTFALLSTFAAIACAPVDGTDAASNESASAQRPPEVQFGVAVSASQTALDAFFVNTEARPVTCETLKFSAPVASLDMCSSPLATQPITLKKVSFDANAKVVYREGQTPGALGGAELTALGTLLGKDSLVYCAPAPTLQEADCGFDCEKDGAQHKYGDEWGVETINGSGERKWTCNNIGEPTISAVCAVVDGAKKRPGDSWSVAVDNGTILKTCLASGDIQSSPQCNSGFELSPDHTSCQPASCGNVPNGGGIVTRPVPNGHYEGICDHGISTNEHLVCNPEFVVSNETCVPRPRKACGAHPDGSTWVEPSCVNGMDAVTNFRCNDGTTVRTGQTERKPKRVCTL